jgi:DNA-binding transcriptional MerR regulator
VSEVRYIISDASRMIDVEPHVLRYWEDELQLDIPRNEMGHRYYRPDDIKVLESIKNLKNQGLQLKAIKLVIANSNGMDNFQSIQSLKLDDVNKVNEEHHNLELKEDLDLMTDEMNKNEVTIKHNISSSMNTYSDKVVMFQNMIRDMLEDVVSKSNGELNKTLTYSISENVIKQMDYLLRMNEEKEDERFKKLDESIREVQKARKELGKKNRLQKIFG